MSQDTATLLAELSPAGRPWLAIDLAGPAGPGRLRLDAGDVTVIDIADPYAVPVTVNPFQPAPGYPVQAHADRLAGLFEASFGLAEPVAAALRAGLRRAYADCGWDTVTGAAAPGAVTAPAVPRFSQFKAAIAAAVTDLGYGASMQAAVQGLVQARLDALWAGPAGRFLEGGHPVDVGSLLRGHVLVTGTGVADEESVAFLAGVLLVAVAGQRRRPGGPGGTVLIGAAGRLSTILAGPSANPAVSSAAAGWFSRLLGDIRAGGVDVIVAGPAGPAGAVGPAGAAGPAGALAGPPRAAAGPAARPAGESGGDPLAPLVLLGRRSAACGERCGRRPCHGYELHAADVLARGAEQAWLRLWVQTLVLAFLTARPLPRVPAPLRSGWRVLSPRHRECVLATVIDAAVAERAAALRPAYDPRCLTSVISAVAARMLDVAARGDLPLAAGTVRPVAAMPFRAGHVWVIPQLRWLHEMDRVNPAGPGHPRFDDIAPPLDFALAGLPDWPGIRVRDRLAGLRRHPLSMESGRNREPATVALLGASGGAGGGADGGTGRPAGLDADLAITGLGLSPGQRLRHAARAMGIGGTGQDPGWLEVVLGWPQQFVMAAPNSDVRLTATG